MKCSYCSTEITKGTGMMYVHKTGAINYFCSKRCFKSMITLKRSINKKETRLVKAKV